MSRVTEDFADVVKEGRQNDLIVGTGALGSRCDLQSVVKLTDLAAVTN
jgi:hypothetical protein